MAAPLLHTHLIEGAFKQLGFKEERQLSCHVYDNLLKHLYQQASLEKCSSIRHMYKAESNPNL